MQQVTTKDTEASADAAAWSAIADAAERALLKGGLSREATSDMAEVTQSARRAAGLPPLRLRSPAG